VVVEPCGLSPLGLPLGYRAPLLGAPLSRWARLS
jgi:hypothetical protein